MEGITIIFRSNRDCYFTNSCMTTLVFVRVSVLEESNRLSMRVTPLWFSHGNGVIYDVSWTKEEKGFEFLECVLSSCSLGFFDIVNRRSRPWAIHYVKYYCIFIWSNEMTRGADSKANNAARFKSKWPRYGVPIVPTLIYTINRWTHGFSSPTEDVEKSATSIYH